MKGEFDRLTFTAKKDFGGVVMEQGRVTLDSDWDEKVDVQVDEAGLVYVEVFERIVSAAEDGSLGETALGGPDTGARGEMPTGRIWKLRLTGEAAHEGEASSTLDVRLRRGSLGTFLLPKLEVSVDGVPWRRTASLSGSGPNDQVYVIGEGSDDGSATVVFGDGERGARPPQGSEITGTYRFGQGGASLGDSCRR